LKVVLDSPVVHQPRTVSEGELAKGQCRECGAINEADREFCGACGEKIFQPCLACEVEIGVWEQVCGECGAKQVELLNDGRARMLEPVNSPELPGTGPDRGDTVQSPKPKEQGDSTIADRELPRSQHGSKTPGTFTLRGFMIAAVVVLPAMVLVFMLVGGDEDEVVPVSPPAPTTTPIATSDIEVGTVPPLPEPVSPPAPTTTPIATSDIEVGTVPPLPEPVSPGNDPGGPKVVVDENAPIPPPAGPTPGKRRPSSVPGGMEITNSIGVKLRLIPAGKFMIGSPGTESDRDDDETQHRVSITKPFYLGVTEVTQEQYQKVMGTNPSYFKRPQGPVERVSWAAAVEFCGKLSAMPAEKTAGHVYRLPTEAEWEYACRSGTTTAYSFGDDASRLGDYGWLNENSVSSTHPVGEKKPNAWGLYDMHGNVWEWCQDRYYGGATSGSLRVYRGGSWLGIARYCRSANRLRNTPEYRDSSLGFRVLRSSIK
jgi:formylglycine-generating enzyme required for sulfatase activity